MLLFLRLAKSSRQTECGVKLQERGDGQREFPFVATERTEVKPLHQHQASRDEEQKCAHDLLPTQAAHGDVAPLVALLQLHGSKHQAARGEDVGRKGGEGGNNGENGAHDEQDAADLVDEVLEGGEGFHERWGKWRFSQLNFDSGTLTRIGQ